MLLIEFYYISTLCAPIICNGKKPLTPLCLCERVTFHQWRALHVALQMWELSGVLKLTSPQLPWAGTVSGEVNSWVSVKKEWDQKVHILQHKIKENGLKRTSGDAHLVLNISEMNCQQLHCCMNTAEQHYVNQHLDVKNNQSHARGEGAFILFFPVLLWHHDFKYSCPLFLTLNKIYLYSLAH